MSKQWLALGLGFHPGSSAILQAIEPEALGALCVQGQLWA